MKRFTVIGLGGFGTHLAQSLANSGHEVIAMDMDGPSVDEVAPVVSRAVVGDGTDRDLLERVGVDSSDAVIVSVGGDLTASILITMTLNDLDVEDIYVKVTSSDHARIIERFKVTETIFPERESAKDLGKRLCGRAVMTFYRLADGYAIEEIAAPKKWLTKTLRTLELPNQHGVHIVAVRDVLQDQFLIPPDPDRPLKPSDTILLAGPDDALAKIANL